MYDAVTAALREAAAAGARVRIRGGGTKLAWGAPAPDPDVEIDMRAYDRVLEHNEGDLTVVAQAGVQLARLQEQLARAGQMLAIDPPRSDGATVGGVLATADSGPLRHRYGAPRDLVLGVTTALSDGTLARAGGKVIKNVAGYDLAKLFTGSFGTLGAILEVALRLHPLAPTASAVGCSADADAVAAGAAAITHSSIEAQCVDVRWWRGLGCVLVRLAGTEAEAQAREAARLMADRGLEEAVEKDDDPLWDEQRARQRSADGAVLKVSGRPTDLANVIRAAEAARATVVSRAALGLSWIALAPGDDLGERVATIRSALSPRACTVLDGAARVEDPWPDAGGAQVVMERLKARFDPARIFRPGTFVGGI
jgi:glycolate oxidase FAD binding subunit